MATQELTLFEDLEAAAHLPAGSINMLGLSLTEPMEFEDWRALGRGLGEMARWTPFAIGDWFNYGEATFGEDEALQATDPAAADRNDLVARTTGLEPGTLKNYSSLCSRVPLERRRPDLRFRHHEAVAALDPEDQVAWLQRAVDEGLTSDELRALIKEAKGQVTPPIPGTVEVLPPPQSIDDRAFEVLQLIVANAQPTSDGSALIPAEIWAQARAAVGEE